MRNALNHPTRGNIESPASMQRAMQRNLRPSVIHAAAAGASTTAASVVPLSTAGRQGRASDRYPTDRALGANQTYSSGRFSAPDASSRHPGSGHYYAPFGLPSSSRLYSPWYQASSYAHLDSEKKGTTRYPAYQNKPEKEEEEEAEAIAEQNREAEDILQGAPYYKSPVSRVYNNDNIVNPDSQWQWPYAFANTSAFYPPALLQPTQRARPGFDKGSLLLDQIQEDLRRYGPNNPAKPGINLQNKVYAGGMSRPTYLFGSSGSSISSKLFRVLIWLAVTCLIGLGSYWAFTKLTNQPFQPYEAGKAFLQRVKEHHLVKHFTFSKSRELSTTPIPSVFSSEIIAADTVQSGMSKSNGDSPNVESLSLFPFTSQQPFYSPGMSPSIAVSITDATQQEQQEEEEEKPTDTILSLPSLSPVIPDFIASRLDASIPSTDTYEVVSPASEAPLTPPGVEQPGTPPVATTTPPKTTGTLQTLKRWTKNLTYPFGELLT